MVSQKDHIKRLASYRNMTVEEYTAHFIDHNEEWQQLRFRYCQKDEKLNPILIAKGGELKVEQFGMTAYLDNMFSGDFWQCAMVESEQPGSGKFDEFLQNMQKLIKEEFDSELVFANIINGHLYKYLARHEVPVHVGSGKLMKIIMKPKQCEIIPFKEIGHTISK
ncbi:MAG: hypothetical protein V3U02_04625 [Calditrichia bacterium]